MKLKVLLFPALLSLAAAAVMAQGPSQPASAGATPAAEPTQTAPNKKSAVKKRVPLDPPAAAVVKSDAVNVRGQPSFNGEVLGHLKKGDNVTVQAQITLRHPPKGEPAEWSQIALPADMAVWVDGRFIDADTKAVKARKINLRGGPGENYSVVGRLEKGAAVTEIRNKDGWLAIQPPTNAYAFVAAGFLNIQAAPPAPAPEPPPPVNLHIVQDASPPPASVQPAPASLPPANNDSAPVAPAPTAQSQADQELAALRQATAAQPATATAAAVPPPEPPPGTPAAKADANSSAVTPRIVIREGYVHRSYNVQSPTGFELHEIQSDRLIEYLEPSPSINLRPFIGTRVTVTGPEFVDRNWPRTPIIKVQSIGLIP